VLLASLGKMSFLLALDRLMKHAGCSLTCWYCDMIGHNSYGTTYRFFSFLDNNTTRLLNMLVQLGVAISILMAMIGKRVSTFYLMSHRKIL